MPLSREQKQHLLESYEQGLGQAPHVFVLGYRGIDVPQVTELRAKVRESGGHYTVVKNTLALKAIRDLPLGELREHFEGPTAVAYSLEEPVKLAKALTEFAKDVPVIEFRAGMVDSRPVASEEIQAIAELPSREELLSKLLFLLQSPITGLARVLGALPQQFVQVLDQVRQAKEKE